MSDGTARPVSTVRNRGGAPVTLLELPLVGIDRDRDYKPDGPHAPLRYEWTCAGCQTVARGFKTEALQGHGKHAATCYARGA